MKDLSAMDNMMAREPIVLQMGPSTADLGDKAFIMALGKFCALWFFIRRGTKYDLTFKFLLWMQNLYLV
jgi:hypothetical protein